MGKWKRQQKDAEDGEDGEGDEEAASGIGGSVKQRQKDSLRGYDYLLSMPIWSLTQERVDSLLAKRDASATALQQLTATRPVDMWTRDLDHFLQTLDDVEEDKRQRLEEAMQSGTKRKAPPAKKTRRTSAAVRAGTAMAADAPAGVAAAGTASAAPTQKRGQAKKAAVVRKPRVTRKVATTSTIATQVSGAAAAPAPVRAPARAPLRGTAIAKRPSSSALSVYVDSSSEDEEVGMSLVARMRMRKKEVGKPSGSAAAAKTTVKDPPSSDDTRPQSPGTLLAGQMEGTGSPYERRARLGTDIAGSQNQEGATRHHDHHEGEVYCSGCCAKAS